MKYRSSRVIRACLIGFFCLSWLVYGAFILGSGFVMGFSFAANFTAEQAGAWLVLLFTAFGWVVVRNEGLGSRGTIRPMKPYVVAGGCVYFAALLVVWTCVHLHLLTIPSAGFFYAIAAFGAGLVSGPIAKWSGCLKRKHRPA